MEKITWYKDFYGTIACIRTTEEETTLHIQGFLSDIFKTYKTENGAKIALGRFSDVTNRITSQYINGEKVI